MDHTTIADSIARFCADGIAKYGIFIRPALAGCLEQGILPQHGLRAVASWFIVAQWVTRGQLTIDCNEPNLTSLRPLLDDPAAFCCAPAMWGELPNCYPVFAPALMAAITDMEASRPI